MRGLSRREFLGGAAGIAAVPALSLSQRSTIAAVSPLAGATVNELSYNVGNYLHAAEIFNGYVGLPLATTVQKIYLGNGALPSTPPTQMTDLAASGCQFVVDVRPSKAMTSTERSRLARFLGMLNGMNLPYRVLLYSECNNNAFENQAVWQAYWSYYAPVVKAAGVLCGYDPGCGYYSLRRAETFFPSNPAPDELWMDFYATAFRSGSRIDNLLAIAQAAGVPAGLAEWGWAAGATIFAPMVMPWWTEYGDYLVNLLLGKRLALGAIYFGCEVKGSNRDVIGSSSDPRIPMIHKVASAVKAG